MEKRSPREDLCGDVSFSLGKWKQTQPREGKFVGPERKGGGELKDGEENDIEAALLLYSDDIIPVVSLCVTLCPSFPHISSTEAVN